MCGCKRRWRSLPNDGPPDIGGILIAGAISQAVTTRSAAHAALVCSLLLLDATRWRHVQGTKPNGCERMGRSPGGDTYTHLYNLHTVI